MCIDDALSIVTSGLTVTPSETSAKSLLPKTSVERFPRVIRAVVDSGAAYIKVAPAIALAAAYQVIDVGGAKILADATGLSDDETVYTATITCGKVSKVISVVGSEAQDYESLIEEINRQIEGLAVAGLAAGDLKVTASVKGSFVTLEITDTDLFSSLTDFVEVSEAEGGTDVEVTATTSDILITTTPVLLAVPGLHYIAYLKASGTPIFNITAIEA